VSSDVFVRRYSARRKARDVKTLTQEIASAAPEAAT
jgi:hypothetical protein